MPTTRTVGSAPRSIFLIEFELAYGYEPPYQAAQGAASVLTLADALERAGTLEADELKALAPEALIERGRLIHRRLWLLQRVLGLSVPIYVVLTKCDELYGFKALLPRELRRAGEAGSVLAWRDQDLDRALDLFTAHDGFAVGRLSSFPDGLRARARELAEARLSAAMLRAVVDAQQLGQRDQASWRPAAEPELLAEVHAFRSAGPRLDRIIAIFDQLGRLQTARALEAIVVAQAPALLAELDRLLAAQGPYLPLRSLDFWLGETPVLLAAYDVGDDLEAQLYLDFNASASRSCCARSASRCSTAWHATTVRLLRRCGRRPAAGSGSPTSSLSTTTGAAIAAWSR